jgi:hypothetical protein
MTWLLRLPPVRLAPRGLLGCLVLALLVELGIASNPLRFRHLWNWDWWLTARAATRAATRCEVLCFGDSLVKFGVLPSVLEARLGGRAYNLSLSAGQPPACYFLLRRALESGARPRALLVDFVPHGLAGDPRCGNRLWPELLDARDALDLAWTARDTELAARVLLARLLPSLRGRYEIRANILAALRGEAPMEWLASHAYVRNTRINRGAYVAAKNPGFRGNADLFAQGDCTISHVPNSTFSR